MSKEYIERNALLERLSYNSPMNLPPMEYYREVVAKFPAADVEPVRHGEWISPSKDYYACKCSECGAIKIMRDKYCGNCGAKMDGGKEQ